MILALVLWRLLWAVCRGECGERLWGVLHGVWGEGGLVVCWVLAVVCVMMLSLRLVPKRRRGRGAQHQPYPHD